MIPIECGPGGLCEQADGIDRTSLALYLERLLRLGALFGREIRILRHVGQDFDRLRDRFAGRDDGEVGPVHIDACVVRPAHFVHLPIDCARGTASGAREQHALEKTRGAAVRRRLVGRPDADPDVGDGDGQVRTRGEDDLQAVIENDPHDIGLAFHFRA